MIGRQESIQERLAIRNNGTLAHTSNRERGRQGGWAGWRVGRRCPGGEWVSGWVCGWVGERVVGGRGGGALLAQSPHRPMLRIRCCVPITLAGSGHVPGACASEAAKG